MKKKVIFSIVVVTIAFGLLGKLAFDYFSKPILTLQFELEDGTIKKFHQRYDYGTTFDEPVKYVSKMKNSITELKLDNELEKDYYVCGYFLDKEYKKQIEMPYLLKNNTTLYVKSLKYKNSSELSFGKDTDFNKIKDFFIKWGTLEEKEYETLYTIWETKTYTDEYNVKRQERNYITLSISDGNTPYFQIGQEHTTEGKVDTSYSTLKRNVYGKFYYQQTLDNAFYRGDTYYWQSGPTYETLYDDRYTETKKTFCTYGVSKYAGNCYIEKYRSSLIEQKSYDKNQTYEENKSNEQRYGIMYIENLQPSFIHADTIFKKIDASYDLWK